MRSIWVGAVLALVLALTIRPALALTLSSNATLEAVIDASDLIVVADVVGRDVERVQGPRGEHDETYTELSVVQFLKGAGPTTLFVRQRGAVGSARVVGDAELRIGSRVVVLLASPRGRFFHLTLLGLSAYDLVLGTDGWEARPQHRTTQRRGAELGATLSFAELERTITERVR
jgi:hypothetical protein